MIPSLPLDVQGGIQGGLDDVAVNPLRLAALAASPFCFRKKGRASPCPLRSAKGDSPLSHPLWILACARMTMVLRVPAKGETIYAD